MERKYRALRVVSMLYKLISILVLGFGVYFAIAYGLAYFEVRGGAIVTNLPPSQVALGIATIALAFFGGLLLSISIFAFANLIDLLMATEENTRATAALLRRMAQSGSRPPDS